MYLTEDPPPIVRPSSRLVILNQRNELLMFHHQDSERSYWILPGGGVDKGETWEQAAIREMWEETGIKGVELGPWVWFQVRIGTWLNPPMIAVQHYYLIRLDGVEPSNANQFEHEREVYVEHRWWSLAELETSTETHYPDQIAKFVAPLMAGELPPEPIYIGD